MVMEPLMDFCNLPELLAVDLEQSSDVFQSRQLTSGAPAPGLADDGIGRRYSFNHNSSYMGPFIPSRPLGILSSSESLQTIHQKYSDVFAPLDFNAHKRDSMSSSDSSADLEPSIGTREESVLTIDTWLDYEKQPPSTFQHNSPTIRHADQISWIDLEAEDLSPITIQRRRCSMTDFPEPVQLLRGANEAENLRAMSLNSRIVDGTEVPWSIDRHLTACPRGIPNRRSSLNRERPCVASQLEAYHYKEEETFQDIPKPHGNNIPYTYGDTGTPFHEDKINSTLRGTANAPSYNAQTHSTFHETMPSRSQASENRAVPRIASDQVGFEEWLESDTTHPGCEDPVLPRPLPPNTLETIQFFVTNFPEPMLMCNSLLIDQIRDLCRGVRYNIESLASNPQATSAHLPNSHPPSRTSKWRWFNSSRMDEETTLPEDEPDTLPVGHGEWKVIQKIFPHGSGELSEALYAYVLTYNYITLLCRRFLANEVDHTPPTTPWATARPDTARSDHSEIDMYGLTPPRPSMSEANGIPRKAASILGMGEEDPTFVPPPPPFTNSTRPSSRDGGSRTSTFTGIRSVPSLFFPGLGQGPRRRSDSRGSTTRPDTAAGRSSFSFSRPTTPVGNRAGMGMRSMTSTTTTTTTTTGQHIRPDQGRQLLEIRRGLALCCARLTVTLHRASPNTTTRKDDKDCRVDPSFMRSLCENVRNTEEAIGRSK